jgi:hypothetical protein
MARSRDVRFLEDHLATVKGAHVNSDNFEFEQKAHQILINSKNYSANDIALKLGIKYDTLYRRLSMRTHFKSWEISALLKVCPELSLAKVLMRDTGFEASLRQPSLNSQKSIKKHLFELNHCLANLMYDLRNHCEPFPKDVLCELEQGLLELQHRINQIKL